MSLLFRFNNKLTFGVKLQSNYFRFLTSNYLLKRFTNYNEYNWKKKKKRFRSSLGDAQILFFKKNFNTWKSNLKISIKLSEFIFHWWSDCWSRQTRWTRQSRIHYKFKLLIGSLLRFYYTYSNYIRTIKVRLIRVVFCIVFLLKNSYYPRTLS